MHATFFMLGENHVDKRPAEVKRIDAEGHELANHTWSHQILTDIEPAEAKRELSRVQDAVRKITGKTPRLMRRRRAGRMKRSPRSARTSAWHRSCGA